MKPEHNCHPPTWNTSDLGDADAETKLERDTQASREMSWGILEDWSVDMRVRNESRLGFAYLFYSEQGVLVLNYASTYLELD